jgi:hypothetical protein
MSHAANTSKSASKAGEALKKNRSWTAAIWALIVVFLLGIGGTVFYGAVVQPQILKAKDLAACKTFEYNYAQGQLAWVKEATATKHTPDPKVAVDNYLAHLYIGVNKGYAKADPNGTVAKSFQQLALSRLQYDSSTVEAIQSGFQTIDSEASSLKTYCDTLMPKASPSPSN